MQDIKLDDLSNVTGGNSAPLREAIKTIKTVGNPDPFALGVADGRLTHAVGHDSVHMDKPRPWLGGSSISGRIDHFLSAFPR